jgi:hypothetical protein
MNKTDKAAYDRHRKVIRAAKIRAKEKETADYRAAHPEIIREIIRKQNIATTRSWWGRP